MDETDKCDFVIELARRLHQGGATAPRLEDAINAVSRRLGLDTHIWSSPTAIIATIQPLDARDHDRTITRVVRLEPGDIHLRRLWRLDDIAERVASGAGALPPASWNCSAQRCPTASGGNGWRRCSASRWPRPASPVC